MERNIIIEERSDIIAQTILQQINKMDKTIVFCVDQGHALRLRDAINKYKQVSDPDYCVRVTSDE
jgi:type I restriction enzyme R subunit